MNDVKVMIEYIEYQCHPLRDVLQNYALDNGNVHLWVNLLFFTDLRISKPVAEEVRYSPVH